MNRLVSDSGPILHLHEAGALHLLPLIGTVTITPLVLVKALENSSLWMSSRVPAQAHAALEQLFEAR